jgi:hypothetical protein
MLLLVMHGKESVKRHDRAVSAGTGLHARGRVERRPHGRGQVGECGSWAQQRTSCAWRVPGCPFTGCMHAAKTHRRCTRTAPRSRAALLRALCRCGVLWCGVVRCGVAVHELSQRMSPLAARALRSDGLVTRLRVLPASPPTAARGQLHLQRHRHGAFRTLQQGAGVAAHRRAHARVSRAGGRRCARAQVLETGPQAPVGARSSGR